MKKNIFKRLLILTAVPFCLFTNSCTEVNDEIKITYKLVYFENNVNILDDKYHLTVIYEKGHVYSENDETIGRWAMYSFYHDSGAPYNNSCYETMNFELFYIFDGEKSGDMLTIGTIFEKDSTYVCYSNYNPNNKTTSSTSDGCTE